MSNVLNRISENIIKGDATTVVELTQAALKEGYGVEKVLNQGLLAGMNCVGDLFGKGEMFIPEVLLSARAMQAAMDILKPQLVSSGVKMLGKVIIGTVKGDLHTIGKNLVSMMLEGAGFEVLDLGVDVSPDKFVEAVKQEKPDIVGMSALLTTTMHAMAHTIKALQEAGVRDRVKIMVGGAPVTRDFAKQIGADGYGSNALAAVELAKKFVGATS